MALFSNKRSMSYDEEDDALLNAMTVEDIPVRSEISHSAMQMKVVKPKKLIEATEIADSLKGGQTIVLNLDELSDAHARRILDYIAGVIYAINGKIERPSDRTFLLTPKGVTVATEEDSEK